MKINRTGMQGVVVIDLDAFEDDRGSFMETYNRERYAEHGLEVEFVQDNRSCSSRNVLRGLHYQISHPQGHLVQVTRGKVFDVGVDLRRDSPTFGKWFGVTLSADRSQQVFFPAGIAHGFCTLSRKAEILYKCTDFFYPEDEGGVLWKDPDVQIDWPIKDPIVKERDSKFRTLKEISPNELPVVKKL